MAANPKDDPMYVEPYNIKPLLKGQGPLIFRLLKEAEALVTAKGTPRDRYDQLITISEKVSKAITPYTPCRDGCNHCCYMAVAISDIEAETISRYTGKAMAVKGTIEDFLRYSDEKIEGYTGQPCTFLAADGKCSIYTVRPIACRTHHNLGKDSENCRIKDVIVKMNTPVLNVTEIQNAAVTIAMTQAHVGFADIREYFPNPSKDTR